MSRRNCRVVQAAKTASATSDLNKAPRVFQDQNHSSQILSLLKRDTTYCDVTIEAQGKQFRVHKNLFGTYSSFFNREFGDEMICKVELDGVTADIAEALVNFFYTGNITINMGNVFEYLMAADYLLIKQVKEHAAKFLHDFINEDNCLDIWHIGKKLNIDSLKTKSATFVGTNLKGIVEKDAFAPLDVKDFEKMMKIAKEHRTNEEENYLVVVSWIKRDLQSRRAFFIGFFQNLNHNLLSKDFLKEVALNEALARCSADVVSSILDELVNRHDKLTEDITEAALNRPFKEKCLLMVSSHTQNLYKFDGKTTTCLPLPLLASSSWSKRDPVRVVIGEHNFRFGSNRNTVESCIVQNGKVVKDWTVIKSVQTQKVSFSSSSNASSFFSLMFVFNEKLYIAEEGNSFKKLHTHYVVTHGWRTVDLPLKCLIANICAV